MYSSLTKSALLGNTKISYNCNNCTPKIKKTTSFFFYKIIQVSRAFNCSTPLDLLARVRGALLIYHRFVTSHEAKPLTRIVGLKQSVFRLID